MTTNEFVDGFLRILDITAWVCYRVWRGIVWVLIEVAAFVYHPLHMICIFLGCSLISVGLLPRSGAASQGAPWPDGWKYGTIVLLIAVINHGVIKLRRKPTFKELIRNEAR